MISIEPIGSSAVEDYLTLFHRYITRGIDALCRRIVPEQSEVPEQGELSTETREQAWHLLDYGLKLTNSWEMVRTLLLALAPHMERAGFRHEWLPYLERGVACSRRVQDTGGEAQLGYYIGRLYRLHGDLAQAHSWFVASANLQRQSENRRGEAMALNQLAYVERLQSRYAQAAAHVADALRLLDENDNERATSHWVLGTMAQDQLEWATAEAHHRAALQIWRDAENPQRVAWSLQNVGDTLRNAERYGEASDYIKQAIAMMGHLHDPVNQAIARMTLGIVHLDQGETEEAVALFTLAEATFRQVDDHLHLAMAHNNLCGAYRTLQKFQEAIQAGETSVRLWEALGDSKYLANTLDEVGLCYLAQNRAAEAVATFERALAILAQLPPGPFQEMLRNMLIPHLDEAHKLASG